MCVALGVAVAASGASAGELLINGSTTVLPFAQIAVERFAAEHPEVKISISGGGSGNGIKALIDKTTDIANASREIKGSEINQAKANGVTPFETTVALDCIVPLVHPSNSAANLTFEQLKKIYTGAVVNWKEVGGPDAPIVVVGRDSSSGTYGTWQELIVEKDDGETKSRVVARAQIVASSGAMLTTVAGNRYAIGYDGIGYVNPTVKALSVEGVNASIATAKDGSYPLSRKLYMYTNGAPAGDAKAFIDYVLSPEGQKIVADTGFIALSAE
jgi:phosphate transport system substrate-binding protein